MTTYYVDFNNQASQTWTMAVYQELPNSIGLQSVSWKQSTAPVGGSTGVSWEESYNVAIADYKQEGGRGVYKASQTLKAALGTAWEIAFEDNVQQLRPVGTTTPGQILINNKSKRLANPGIGMSGQGSVYKRDVVDGASAQFLVTPTYWVGLFNNVILGEVISSNVIVGPLQIKFPSGMNRATLDATMDGSSILLSLTYSSALMTQSFVVQERLKLEKLTLKAG
ncbi:MAG: hypothetical protein R3B70_03905 [Polyangiaceae bacterium]